MRKIRFQAVVEFEIDEATAVSVLADKEPGIALDTHLKNRHDTADDGFVGSFNSTKLKEAYGKWLVETKVSEAKQLPASTTPAFIEA